MATFKLELPSYANAKDDLNNDNEKTEIKSKENEEGISKDDNKGNVGLPEASSSQKLSTEEDRRKREVILMDGPLSRIYTEALNMVYVKPFNKQVEEIERKKLSQDSYITDGMQELQLKQMSDCNKDEDIVNLYVYTSDNEKVTNNLTNSIQDITNLSKRSNRDGVDLYVSVECRGNMSKETLSFINYCNSKNCKLFTNKDNCLRTIISNFKG